MILGRDGQRDRGRERRRRTEVDRGQGVYGPSSME